MGKAFSQITRNGRAFKILAGKPTEKRTSGTPRSPKEMGLNNKTRTDWVHDRDNWRIIVNTVLKLRVPRAIKLFKLYRTLSIY
jgi:hypothetical protein